jgi:hypothetical protein
MPLKKVWHNLAGNWDLHPSKIASCARTNRPAGTSPRRLGSSASTERPCATGFESAAPIANPKSAIDARNGQARGRRNHETLDRRDVTKGAASSCTPRVRAPRRRACAARIALSDLPNAAPMRPARSRGACSGPSQNLARALRAAANLPIGASTRAGRGRALTGPRLRRRTNASLAFESQTAGNSGSVK